jgi:hypothetical protein
MGEFMNKNELLDEVVLSFDGKWPSRDCRYMHEFLSKNTYSMNNYGDYSVCTRDAFEQRARELGYGVEAAEPDSWYDYTNQKALRLPPIGVECEYEDSPEVKNYSKCTILAVLNEAFAFSRPDYKNTIFTGNLRTHVLRPLDHATRKAEAERKRVVDAVMKFWMSVDTGTTATFEKLYDAGFLRMPEDK